MAAPQPDEAEGLPDAMTLFDDTSDDDAHAAEYVLHLLDDAECAAFEARLGTDRALQSRVHDWEARLAPLMDDVTEATPSAAVRRRLLETIGDAKPSRRASPFWAWLAGGVAAAGIMVFALFGDVFRPAPDLTPAFQAELASDDRSLVIIAGVIPATHEIVLERIAGGPEAGRVHELWLIPEDDDTPISLGILKNEGITRIVVPDDIAPSVRPGTIAISLEPLGGSPTGAPTGAVVAVAQFSDL